MDRVQKALREGETAELLGLDNVVAVGRARKVKAGQETGSLAVKVFTTAKVPKELLRPDQRIPRSVAKVQTDVEEIGEMPPLPLCEGEFPDKPYGYRDPFMIGDEIGPERHSQAGTVTAIIHVPLQGDYALTCHHVVHPKYQSLHTIGRGVTQPAYNWSGQPDKRRIGRVVEQMAPRPDFVCQVDSALIELEGQSLNPEEPAKGWRFPGTSHDAWLDYMHRTGTFQHYGRTPLIGRPHYHADYNALVRDVRASGLARPTPAGFGTVEIGDPVWKAGRSTGITHGIVHATDLIIRTDYGGVTGWVTFEDQILVKRIKGDPEICKGGDSGAPVIDEDNNIVGQVRAGNSRYYVTPTIQAVLRGVLPPVAGLNLNREVE